MKKTIVVCAWHLKDMQSPFFSPWMMSCNRNHHKSWSHFWEFFNDFFRILDYCDISIMMILDCIYEDGDYCDVHDDVLMPSETFHWTWKVATSLFNPCQLLKWQPCQKKLHHKKNASSFPIDVLMRAPQILSQNDVCRSLGDKQRSIDQTLGDWEPKTEINFF